MCNIRLSEKDGFEKIQNEIKELFNEINVETDIRTLNVENTGSVIL